MFAFVQCALGTYINMVRPSAEISKHNSGMLRRTNDDRVSDERVGPSNPVAQRNARCNDNICLEVFRSTVISFADKTVYGQTCFLTVDDCFIWITGETFSGPQTIANVQTTAETFENVYDDTFDVALKHHA